MNTHLPFADTPHSGILITFCGLDGSGKTTQIQLLERELQRLGLPVFLTKQPTDFVRQSDIFRTFMDTPNHDAYDYKALSLLAASDRVQHSNRTILPQLTEGKAVISDRYYYCCLANLRARGYPNDRWVYEVAESIPGPDLAFFTDVEVDTAISRVRARESERNRYIDVDLQHKLRHEFLRIACDNDGIILSTKEPAHVTADKVRAKLHEMLPLLEKKYAS